MAFQTSNFSTFVNDTSVGTKVWTNPGNAAASDNLYADVALAANEITYYLKCTGASFTIPATATIDGIVVEVEKKASAANRAVDYSVRLVKGGVIVGLDKASATYWPTADTYVSYGSSTDLWGETWTPADINSANFGVVISAKGVATVKASIDHVRVTVYYTELVAKSALESGAGSDAFNAMLAGLTSTEAGAGQDVLSVLKALLTGTDSGSGTDVFVQILPLLVLSSADSGIGTEAFVSMLAALQTSEAGTGTDILQLLLSSFSTQDTGTGSDAVQVLLVPIPSSDGGVGSDVFSSLLSTLLTRADSGTGTDVGEITLLLPTVVDSGTGTDRVVLLGLPKAVTFRVVRGAFPRKARLVVIPQEH